MNIESIEKHFSEAKYIGFYPDDKPNPTVVGLIFEYEGIKEAISSYKLLHETYGRNDLTFTIRKQEDNLKVSLISRSTKDVINIGNLPHKGLYDFIQKEPSNAGFIFAIIQETENGMTLMSTNSNNDFILVQGYTLA